MRDKCPFQPYHKQFKRDGYTTCGYCRAKVSRKKKEAEK